MRLSACSVGIAGLAGTGPDPAIQQARPATTARFQAFQLVVLIQIKKNGANSTIHSNMAPTFK
jgi:hypothetical protein